jgi:hypothetical protein
MAYTFLNFYKFDLYCPLPPTTKEIPENAE